MRHTEGRFRVFRCYPYPPGIYKIRCSPEYIERVKKLGLVQSMSRKGNCLDNAPMESFFGHFKDEVDVADCKTFNELRAEIAKYMQYYNNERQQWNLKKMTPVEYRNHLLSAA